MPTFRRFIKGKRPPPPDTRLQFKTKSIRRLPVDSRVENTRYRSAAPWKGTAHDAKQRNERIKKRHLILSGIRPRQLTRLCRHEPVPFEPQRLEPRPEPQSSPGPERSYPRQPEPHPISDLSPPDILSEGQRLAPVPLPKSRSGKPRAAKYDYVVGHKILATKGSA